MRKNYFRALLTIPAIAFLGYSFSSGYEGAASSSPGDNGNTCAQCHSGGQFQAVATITSNVPNTGYELNKKYTITVSVNSGSSKHGFQLTAENDNKVKTGVFTASSNTRTINNNKTIIHSTPLTNATSWTFDWTSPAIDQGDITFYTAVNATNANSRTSGDQVVTSNLKVQSAITLGVDSFFASQFSIAPNPASDSTTIQVPSSITNAEVTIYDYLGRLVKSQTIRSGSNNIDVKGIAQGLYSVSIRTSEGNVSKTLLIK